MTEQSILGRMLRGVTLLLRSGATWLYLLIRGWPVKCIRMAFAVSNMSWELSPEMQARGDPIMRGENGTDDG